MPHVYSAGMTILTILIYKPGGLGPKDAFSPPGPGRAVPGHSRDKYGGLHRIRSSFHPAETRLAQLEGGTGSGLRSESTQFMT